MATFNISTLLAGSYIGNPGATGSQGGQGDVGATGVQGASGSTGAVGGAGATGASGSIGLTGSTGPAGVNGASGSVGDNGATGATGLTGATGSSGSIGLTGSTGPAGVNGASGSVGDNGATGAAGTNGVNGATGLTGATGSSAGGSSTMSPFLLVGATGSQGSTGPTGNGWFGGALYIGPQGATGVAWGATGSIRATGSVSAFFSSDKTLKENIKDIPNALDKVIKIGGKIFDWTDEYIENNGGLDSYFQPKADFGVIAQDVQEVFPVAVRTREDGTLAVDYEKLCALAFAAIKELNDKIENK